MKKKKVEPLVTFEEARIPIKIGTIQRVFIKKGATAEAVYEELGKATAGFKFSGETTVLEFYDYEVTND